MIPGARNLMSIDEVYGSYCNDSRELSMAVAIVGKRRKVLMAIGFDDEQVGPVLQELLKGAKEIELFTKDADKEQKIHDWLIRVRNSELEYRSLNLIREENDRLALYRN